MLILLSGWLLRRKCGRGLAVDTVLLGDTEYRCPDQYTAARRLLHCTPALHINIYEKPHRCAYNLTLKATEKNHASTSVRKSLCIL